ncbi:hypothetical protein FJT64_008138 [Amphibalanus amphitrite]|uniref:Single domain-containing protein n=1 Tax=Amphibalanus amphitrite TaxID=1232801 RepID=A0A6A4VTW5_AMPAM|nr:hypothetical protein FJT64_008138 [Amphibalanus amphitrite]
MLQRGVAAPQTGSESSFCSEAVLNQLGITGQDEQLCLQTVEGTGKPQASTRVKLELSSVAPGETRRIIVPEAWSVPSLDISMPNVCKKQREKWRHIKDLDIPQCSHGQVELLLGANVSEAVIQQEVRVALPTPSKFSSWTKYKRTVAWILRFLRNSTLKGEQKRQRNLGPLTVSELHDAEKTILQMVQAEAYRTELHQLQASQQLNKKSGIADLSPILDADGILRDGGRWYSVGEQWDDGCTRAICVGTDRVERLSCPGQRYDPSRPDCRLVEGNSSAAFPLCCDSVVCDTPLDVCRDASGASRAAGSVWTERGCVSSRCEIAEGGVAVVRRSRCQPPPSADCRLVEPNPADGADYPYCCPTYLCPGRCYSPVLDRWFFEGDRWAEGGCFESVCESTGTVTQTRCPFVSARRPGCRVVAGDPAAKYPGCCRRVECQP